MNQFVKTVLAAATLAGAAAITSPAVAAEPEGSYLSTCRNVQLYRPQRPDGLLLAECRSRNGTWVVSSLRYKTCGNDIVNNNGTLACGTDYPGDVGGLPPGNWQDSCRDGYIDGGFLYAECRKASGKWQDTALRLNACPNGPVANQNGQLVCGSGQTGSRLTLFSDANFSGESLQLTGPAPDLREYDFSDYASSIRVQGTWYVCTDTNYRGECSAVAGAFNLNSKWNNKISSARPGS